MVEQKRQPEKLQQKLVVTDGVASNEAVAASSGSRPELAAMSTDEFLKFLEEGSADELLSAVPVLDRASPAKQSWFREIVSVPEGDRTTPAVFMWWEGRRPIFNLLVGVFGLPFAIILLLTGFMPPMMVVLGVIGYAFAANACYTLGPLAELVAAKIFGIERAKRLAPELLVLGLIFSILVTIGGGILCVLFPM